MTEQEMNALSDLRDEAALAVKAMVKYPKLTKRAHELEKALADFNAAEKEADCDD